MKLYFIYQFNFIYLYILTVVFKIDELFNNNFDD